MRASSPPAEIDLRPTRSGDLAFVRALEVHPDNRCFIGHWSEQEHLAVIADPDAEHWIIEDVVGRERLGFLIALGTARPGGAIYLKRIATVRHGRGIGTKALRQFFGHAFGPLGSASIRLVVVAGNTRARRLYESLGFVSDAEPLENGNLGMTLFRERRPAPG